MKSALKILQSEKSGTKYKPDKDLQSKFRWIELTCFFAIIFKDRGEDSDIVE